MPRALVLEGVKQLDLVEQPSNPLQPGEARLRSRLSGISHGTELSLYRGTSAFTDKVFDRGLRAFVHPHAGSNGSAYPVTLGYEMVSEVVEVAPGVTAVARRRTEGSLGASSHSALLSSSFSLPLVADTAAVGTSTSRRIADRSLGSSFRVPDASTK